ncbi:MAG: endo-1,4-beta-xylanase [Marinilabiliales bacterium]|nr:endo-1,4-beta-xylanase [Marinilabiliales bacterium]
MNKIIGRIALLCLIFLIQQSAMARQEVKAGDIGLKEALKGKFYIGTALNAFQIRGMDTASVEVVKKHFSAIVPENCLKSGQIQPKEGQFDFTLADQFVDFGERNHLFMTGHVLVWHSQAPAWFFVDNNGNDVSREVLISRMKNHIQTVVTHFKGKLKGWDVVNEAIEDNGAWRKTKFYQIIGEDYIKLAFQFAHEADPDAELYYNDYSMANPGRRAAVVAMVRKLQSEGVAIHGIGMQCHISLTYPDIAEFEKSILAYAELGVKVMITEMDVTVLPNPDANVGADVSATATYQQKINPYADGLPAAVGTQLANRYVDFFKLFLKYRQNISRVTVWGVSDKFSWKNNWPVRGRTDYPLLFDRNNQPKEMVPRIIEEALKIK